MTGSEEFSSLMVGTALLLVAFVLRDVFAGRTPRLCGRFGGEIAVNARLVLAVCAGGLALGGFAFWTTFTTHAGPAVAILGALSLVGAMVAACSLHPDWTIRWTRHGLEGPAALVPFPTGAERAAFTWDSITHAGRDIWGNHFVQNAAGERIRWNAAYAGHAQLMAAVAHNCPHLAGAAHA